MKVRACINRGAAKPDKASPSEPKRERDRNKSKDMYTRKTFNQRHGDTKDTEIEMKHLNF